MILEIGLLIFLALISIIDLIKKTVPAVFTSGAILVIALLNVENLMFGLLALIFALFLIEADFFRGVADMKVTVLLGLMVSTLNTFFLLMLLILLFGLIYKLLMVYVIKQKTETAFVPIFLAVYAVMFFIGIIL